MTQSNVDTPTIEPPTKLKPKRDVRSKTKNKAKNKTKRQPPYAVILHNDDVNGMDFVVGVLRKVFGFGVTKSILIMMKAHVSGQAQLWTGPLEVAELKADQVRSCGPDPGNGRSGCRNAASFN